MRKTSDGGRKLGNRVAAPGKNGGVRARYPQPSPPPRRFVSPRAAEVSARDLKPGDWIEVRDPHNRVMYGDGLFKVIKAGRVNVRASTDVRFAPTGPWHHQEHTIPLSHVVRVVPPSEVAPRGELEEARGHRVSDFNTLDDLAQHARGEGATHIMHIDDEVHLYFRRSDGMYEKAEVWQKDGYWHTQAPGSRAVVQKPPQGAKPIGGRGKVQARRRSRTSHPDRPALSRAEQKQAFYDANWRSGNLPPDWEQQWDRDYDKEHGNHSSVQTAPSASHRRRTSNLKPSGINAAIESWNRGDAYRDGLLQTLIDAGLVEYDRGWRPTADGRRMGVGMSHLEESGSAPHRRTARGAESRGEQYAQDQLQGEYFMGWVREQLAEAARMPPEQVLPLETKRDAMVIARNMLQDLEQDAKRDLQEDAAFWNGFRKALDGSRGWLADELLQIKSEMGGGMREAARRPTKTTKYKPTKGWKLRVVDRIVPDAGGAQRVEFKDGLSIQVHGGHGRGDQLYAMKPTDMRWEGRSPGPESRREYQYAALVAVLNGRPATFLIDSDGDVRATDVPLGTSEAHRVRDYIAIDRRDHPVGPPHKGYDDARKEADAAGGVVKFVPGGKRAPVKEARRRPKARRSTPRRS